ncbi:hypothetical protein BC833DRAFT_356748 [Globomyces pollinis-pini]|nr:hypothetical protein BC833DRAFT_356748 [Globomyces pollinis-pini]
MGQNESTKKESVSQTAIDTKKNKKAKEESEKKKALENSVLESKTNQQKSNKSTNHKDKKKPIEESSALEESTSNHQNKARYIKLGKKHKPNLFIDDEATEDTDSDGASKSTNQQDSLDSNSDSSETSIDSSPSRIKNLHKQKRQNVVSDTDEDESDSFERNIEEAAPKEKKIPRHMSPLIENEAIP